MTIPVICLTDNDWNSLGKEITSTKNWIFPEFNHVVEIMKPTNLDDIPKNSSYVVALKMYGNIMVDFQYSLYTWIKNIKSHKNAGVAFEMPERVWEDSAKGRVTWIIDYTSESDIIAVIDIEGMLRGFNLGEHRKNLILLTGAEKSEIPINPHIKSLTEELGIQIYSWNRIFHFNVHTPLDGFKWYDDFITKKIQDIESGLNAPFKSVMYARIPRPHRIFACAYFKHHGLLDKVIHSLGGSHISPKQSFYYRTKFPEYTKEIEYYENISKTIDCVLREEHVDLQENQAHTVSFQHAFKSYFHIISETMNDPAAFLTEKSIKPIWMGQPFIVLGPQYNVLAMQRRGFRTFDKWIDHSYDDIENSQLRIKAALDETARLINLTSKQWDEMLIEMLPDIVYNVLVADKAATDDTARTLLLNHLLEVSKKSD